MTAISLHAPWEARSTKAKAEKYVSTHSQLEREVRGKFDRECEQYLDIVLSLTDFSEVQYGTA